MNALFSVSHSKRKVEEKMKKVEENRWRRGRKGKD